MVERPCEESEQILSSSEGRSIEVSFDVSSYDLTEVGFEYTSSWFPSTISNIEVTLMNGEEVTLNENIPFSCFENELIGLYAFTLPTNLEGNRFIFNFTAAQVDLSKIMFFG